MIAFKVTRNDTDYRVELYKLHTKMPYRLVVSNGDDCDYLSLSRTRESLNYIREQIKKYLVIKVREGKIDYLELPVFEKRQQGDLQLKTIIWMQAQIRGWLQRLRWKREHANVLCRFYIKSTHVARITVRKV